MPPFIYTILALTALSWWGLIKILTTKTPDSLFNIALFLTVAWITLTLTFSLPVYFWLYKKAEKLLKLRPIYRKGFKKSLLTSSGIVLLLTLKVFGLLTPLNIILLLILGGALLWKAKR